LNIKRIAVLMTAAAMALSLAAPVGAASPNGKQDSKGHGKDNLPGVLAKKQTALKQKALEKVAKGQAKATGKNKVVQVAKGQFVELAQVGEDQIFTLLGQFGDLQVTHQHAARLHCRCGTAARRARSTTRSPRPIGRPTTRPSRPLTSASRTTRTCLQQGPAPVDGELVPAVLWAVQR
jgi:hypothetical protein